MYVFQQSFYKYIGYFELLANTLMMKNFGYNMCRKGAITQPLCELVIYLIGGFSSGEFDYVSHYFSHEKRRILD